MWVVGRIGEMHSLETYGISAIMTLPVFTYHIALVPVSCIYLKGWFCGIYFDGHIRMIIYEAGCKS